MSQWGTHKNEYPQQRVFLWRIGENYPRITIKYALTIKEYLVIILGYLFLFLHKNICYEYWLEVPHWGTSNEYWQCIYSMFLWRTGGNYPRTIIKYVSLSPLIFPVKTSVTYIFNCRSHIKEDSTEMAIAIFMYANLHHKPIYAKYHTSEFLHTAEKAWSDAKERGIW